MLEESFKKIRSEWFDKFIKIKRPIFCQPDVELDELLDRDNLKIVKYLINILRT